MADFFIAKLAKLFSKILRLRILMNKKNYLYFM